MAETSDNSGMGVILGILVAVLLVVGGYFFIQSQGGFGESSSTTNIELPDVNVNTPSSNPAPAQ